MSRFCLECGQRLSGPTGATPAPAAPPAPAQSAPPVNLTPPPAASQTSLTAAPNTGQIPPAPGPSKLRSPLLAGGSGDDQDQPDSYPQKSTNRPESSSRPLRSPLLG